MSTDPIGLLRTHLDSLPLGAVENVRSVIALLELCWDDLSGSGLEGMTRSKLQRIESLEWHSPALSFWLERHGATVLGSTRAEMHLWTVNLETGVADCQRTTRYRQLVERDKPLRVGPLVTEIADAITRGKDDSRLKWYGDGTVRVLVTSFVGGEFKQTQLGRRRRFRGVLDQELHGCVPSLVEKRCGVTLLPTG